MNLSCRLVYSDIVQRKIQLSTNFSRRLFFSQLINCAHGATEPTTSGKGAASILQNHISFNFPSKKKKRNQVDYKIIVLKLYRQGSRPPMSIKRGLRRQFKNNSLVSSFLVFILFIALDYFNLFESRYFFNFPSSNTFSECGLSHKVFRIVILLHSAIGLKMSESICLLFFSIIL